MLSDMDEIDNIEKARAIESVVQTMENFNISIEDLMFLQESSQLNQNKNKNYLRKGYN